MKIAINFTAREVNVIKNIVNKYAPVDGEPFDFVEKNEVHKWGGANMSTYEDNSVSCVIRTNEDFSIDVLSGLNEVIAPLVVAVKAMKSYYTNFRKGLSKWEDSDESVLAQIASSAVKRFSEKETTFIIFLCREEDWVETKPGVKKLKKVTTIKHIDDHRDIQRYADEAIKANKKFVFATYADGNSAIVGTDGAEAFFEDHKACW